MTSVTAPELHVRLSMSPVEWFETPHRNRRVETNDVIVVVAALRCPHEPDSRRRTFIAIAPGGTVCYRGYENFEAFYRKLEA